MSSLKDVSTSDLVDELASRKGIEHLAALDDGFYQVLITNPGIGAITGSDHGPATILVIREAK